MHRDNASMLTVPQQMAGKPRVVGFLVEKELQYLGEALNNPSAVRRHPGRQEVSDKIGRDRGPCSASATPWLIGGAMQLHVHAGPGQEGGRQPGRADKVDEPCGCSKGRRQAEAAGGRHGGQGTQGGRGHAGARGRHPRGLQGFDIGPKTAAEYKKIIAGAKTVAWNGPMGVFEIPPFDKGTTRVANALVEATGKGAVTVIAGAGDSASAIEKAGPERQGEPRQHRRRGPAGVHGRQAVQGRRGAGREVRSSN